MRIIHAGEGALANRVRFALYMQADDIVEVTTPEQLSAALPADWLVSSGYRYRVPDDVLDAVPNNCNVHTAMLPFGRGANPNVWVIANGEPAGVTIHRMVTELDAGPVYAQFKVPTWFDDDGKSLHDRLIYVADDLFYCTWPKMRRGEIIATPQVGPATVHRVADMHALGQIDLNATTTWADAINTLRALTFPPYHTARVTVDGVQYGLDLTITPLET